MFAGEHIDVPSDSSSEVGPEQAASALGREDQDDEVGPGQAAAAIGRENQSDSDDEVGPEQAAAALGKEDPSDSDDSEVGASQAAFAFAGIHVDPDIAESDDSEEGESDDSEEETGPEVAAASFGSGSVEGRYNSSSFSRFDDSWLGPE